VLVAVHDLRMAAQSFDRAVLLDRTVVCQGPAREVIAVDHVARPFYVDQDIERDGGVMAEIDPFGLLSYAFMVLPGVVISYMLRAPYVVGALVAALLACALIGGVGRRRYVRSDASMGIVFTMLFPWAPC